MIQNIIVAIVGAITLFFVVRAIIRKRHTSPCDGCAAKDLCDQCNKKKS